MGEIGTKYYLAIDIGASGGRHILGHMEEGKMLLEEIYRFRNGLTEKGGHLVWNREALLEEILTGMKKCREMGKIPYSVGIDTWAVDFVLIDQAGRVIGEMTGYRDSRTAGMDQKVYELLPEDVLYRKTGIQKQIFNTIYQLMYLKEKHPEQLRQADKMLLIPDYFNYLLTGIKSTEYTNATTTQLINPDTKDWNRELISLLGYPQNLFPKIVQPGAVIGELTPAVQAFVGYSCMVVRTASHDTASAVMALPTDEEAPLYLSSGTWSLMGTELWNPICTEQSRKANFTNEGGYEYRFRYLKNLMGMWMINSIRRECAPGLDFEKLMAEAEKARIQSLLDVSDTRFLAPQSMTEEIRQACLQSGQQVPESVGELAAVIYKSLAACYAQTVCEIEALTGMQFRYIHIVGGGAKAEYLNRLTAQECGKEVLAGPVEGTAIGNVMAQMLSDGVFSSLKEARRCVRDSFPVKHYR